MDGLTLLALVAAVLALLGAAAARFGTDSRDGFGENPGGRLRT
jgi:hypothetical protein